MTIRVPTTFIVGAGASAPYGLPMGKELLQRARDLKPDATIYALIEAALHSKNSHGMDLLGTIEELGSFPEDSIDAFLEKRQGLNQVLQAGKALIAAVLGLSLHQPKEVDEANDWLKYLLQKMLSGADTPDQFIKDNASVRFVTFNFDTFIEERIPRILGESYGSRFALPQDVLQVIHVHGCLPRVPRRAPVHTRDYEFLINEINAHWVRWIAEAIDQIHVTYDEVDPNVLQSAQDAILAANVVCFLGFSFNKRNLTKIGFPLPRRDRPLLYGTAFGLSPSDRFHVEQYIKGQATLGGPDTDCRKLFLDHPVIRQV